MDLFAFTSTVSIYRLFKLVQLTFLNFDSLFTIIDFQCKQSMCSMTRYPFVQLLPRSYIRSFSSSLSHVDGHTNMPKMVDVIEKFVSKRVAHAQARVFLPETAYSELFSSYSSNEKEIFTKKGPVFATAIVSGVLAAKRTSESIPFCHPVSIEKCDVRVSPDSTVPNCIRIDCIVGTTHKTGVEMEALCGATTAALCIYDMLKAITHDIVISDIRLLSKTGGKSDYAGPKA